MGRNANAEKMQAIYDTVRAYPGERAGAIARLLGVRESAIYGALATMEREGYLLSEDERGGLWPFGKRREGRGREASFG